jgi:DNA-binding MarR family transcriptional regulator
VASERPGRRRRFRHLGTHIEGAPVGSLLLQVVRAHAQLGTRLLRREGVVPPQEIVLLHLDEQGPVAQADLVHYLGRDRSTVTNTLQAMERAGLIERTPSPTDRRAMVVGLTEEGRRRIPGARAAWHRLEEVTTRGLTDAQRSALLRALTVVRDELDRALAEDLAEDPDGGPGGRHP